MRGEVDAAHVADGRVREQEPEERGADTATAEVSAPKRRSATTEPSGARTAKATGRPSSKLGAANAKC